MKFRNPGVPNHLKHHINQQICCHYNLQALRCGSQNDTMKLREVNLAIINPWAVEKSVPLKKQIHLDRTALNPQSAL